MSESHTPAASSGDDPGFGEDASHPDCDPGVSIRPTASHDAGDRIGTGEVGVVLAAGAGRRMGMPKALLHDVDDVPLLDRAVAALRDGGCGHVVVVLGARADEVTPLATDGVSIVVADDWADGMGASLRAGLAECMRRGRAERAVVTLVDLPDVDARLVTRLLTATAPDGPSALARATFGGRPGHPVVIGRNHWAAARDAAQGDRGARDLFATREHRLLECADLASGHDVDTPDELHRFVGRRAATARGAAARNVVAPGAVPDIAPTTGSRQGSSHA